MYFCEVSVIIPTYNSALTILRAIQSVLDQTFVDYEIIIVDDGSTDDTRMVIANLSFNINYFYQNNMGASSARNHGARFAKGRLLAFLDADDAWHPQKLELQVAVFNKYPHIGACYSPTIHLDVIDPPVQFIKYRKPSVKIHTNVTEIFECPFLGTPSVIMPSAVFKELNGFDETLTTAEDADLWLRTANRFNIACVDAKLVAVYLSTTSLRSTDINKTYHNNILVINKFCEQNSEFANKYCKLVRRAKALVYESWGSSLLAKGKTKYDVAYARNKLLDSLRLSLTIRPLYLLFRSFIPLNKRDFRINVKNINTK